MEKATKEMYEREIREYSKELETAHEEISRLEQENLEKDRIIEKYSDEEEETDKLREKYERVLTICVGLLGCLIISILMLII